MDATRVASGVPLTIGALSRATGVPVNTLRTWERRYGMPRGDRTEGGHRLYPPDTVDHVRLVVRALDAGHRPAQVLAATPVALERMLGDAPPVTLPSDTLSAWVAATRALDGAALFRGFAEEAARLGLRGFLEQRALPFLRAVGEAWEAGGLGVFQEHFASAQLSDFLAAWWRPLADSGRGRPVVLAGAPGDRHDLGVQMAAALVAVAGHRVVYLGPDTPVADLAAAIEVADARVAVVGVSGTTPDARSAVVALREAVPPEVRILVGGAGAPGDVPGVERVGDVLSVTDEVGAPV